MPLNLTSYGLKHAQFNHARLSIVNGNRRPGKCGRKPPDCAKIGRRTRVR